MQNRKTEHGKERNSEALFPFFSREVRKYSGWSSSKHPVALESET